MKLHPVLVAILIAFTGFLRGEQPAVIVPVEPGDHLISVEKPDPDNPGVWKPVAKAYLNGNAGKVKIALPEGTDTSNLRISASSQSIPWSRKIKTHADPPPLRSEGSENAYAFLDAMQPGQESSREDSNGEKSVEEADIWALGEDYLYFFNQYRGLQLVSLADPDNPELLDNYRYPSYGDQIYYLGNHRVLLITRHSESQAAELVLFSVANGQLEKVSELTLEQGRYRDSRRIGRDFYVWTNENSYERVAENSDDGGTSIEYIRRNENHLHVVQLTDDILSLEQTIQKSSDGSGHETLTADANTLFLSLNYKESSSSDNLNSTILHSYQRLEDGTLEPWAEIPTTGPIQDQYKVRRKNNFISTISLPSNQFGRPNANAATRLENFEIIDGSPRKISQVELAPGESLFATRFDEDLVYIVTFLRKDPLFAIDISDPANPEEVGALEIPGWSTYIELAGNHLISIGVEDNRVALSLFDISDPTNMSLVDRVYPSGEDENSWSEANYEDKAITLLREKELIIFPYQMYGPNGGRSALQVVSFVGGNLTKLGSIEHRDNPRRGTLFGDTLLSVSGQELLSTDLSDPANPGIPNRTPLAWDVSYLFMAGDYLIQVENNRSYGFWGYGYPENSQDEGFFQTWYYVSTLEDPDIALDSGPLIMDSLKGFHVNGNQVEVLSTNFNSEEEEWTLSLSRIDFSDPMNPLIMATDSKAVEAWGHHDLEPQPLGSGEVLWTPKQSSHYPHYYHPMMIDAIWWPYYGQNGVPLVVTSNPSSSAPAILNTTYLQVEEGRFSSSILWQEPYVLTEIVHSWSEENPETGRWEYFQERFVQPLDFSDPRNPVHLEDFKVPGDLFGITSANVPDNYYLFSSEEEVRYDQDSELQLSKGRINVLAWDLAQIFPVAELELPESRNHAQDNIYREDFLYQLRTHREDSENNLMLRSWEFDKNDLSFSDNFSRKIEQPYAYDFNFIQDWLYLSAYNALEVFHIPENQILAEASYTVDNPYNMDLEEGLLDGNQLWVPAGFYGVEYIDLPVGSSDSNTSSPNPRFHTVEQPAWRGIPESNWNLTTKSERDEVGVLNNRRWAFVPDNFQPVFPDATDYGDFWKESDWFGWLYENPERGRWIRHLEHGDFFAYPASSGLWMYSKELGFTWTNPTVYPYLYVHGSTGWMYYLKGSGTEGNRWFYSIKSAEWIRI